MNYCLAKLLLSMDFEDSVSHILYIPRSEQQNSRDTHVKVEDELAVSYRLLKILRL